MDGETVDVGVVAPELPMANIPSVINRERILEAQHILREYKTGKANLEQRIVANEQWYKLRHWELMRSKESGQQVEPVSAWLFNSIANKHADAMDNYPCPNLLPREEGDKKEAEALSSIVPVLLDQCEFEDVYSEAWDDKLRGGTAVYGVFWDPTKAGGIGDVDIRCIDPINLFWEPGCSKIQHSQHLFHVELQNNEQLEQDYPKLKGKLGGSALDAPKYVYDDTVNTANKSTVVDWYYRKKNAQGKTVLHFCKFVGDEVLFASENLPEYRERGWYDHGKYPFVFDPLFRVKGSPCGFGFIDVAKSAQEYIDRCNQAVLKNMLANATPRHFVRSDGSLNEEEFLDITRPLIHVDGKLGEDSIRPMQVNVLSGIYNQIIKDKVDELKETTGNRDISTGGSASGVTAASAIAAMQEAGSKLSRDSNKAAYRAFRKVVELLVELIRQFYDVPRCFRILGENGAETFTKYSNQGILPQMQGDFFGTDLGYRVPTFDIEVTAQKASPYSKLSQNELALQFYGAGFFNPAQADQALMCLDMMDFNGKNSLMQKVANNGGLFRQMQQQIAMLTQMVQQLTGRSLSSEAGPGAAAPTNVPKEAVRMPESKPGEAGNTAKARQRVADSTAPT
ncbi:MAG: hypothetical protein J6K89_07140 [Oscillospiraceae bacterium]|nr:hypothetical protein [Oscillospiraceae bacterium]